MKATLEFDLPEDRVEFEVASHAMDYRGALEEVDSYLRARLKHERLTKSASDALELVRQRLHDEMTQRGISVFD